MSELVDLLKKAGYVVAVGEEETRKLIRAVACDSLKKLCSGYRVFPGGERCKGCTDCKPEQKEEE